MNEFSHDVRVYYEDTDAGGIVYYVNYLKFMERARTEFLRQLGVSQQQMASDSGTLFVVHSLDASYLRPARLDDELRVTAKIASQKRASFDFEQTVCRGDTVLCRAHVRIACVKGEQMKPCPVPKCIAESLAAN